MRFCCREGILKGARIYKKIINGGLPEIRKVADEIIRVIKVNSSHACDDSLFDMKLIINEMLINAIVHGNRDDNTKSIKISACISDNNEVYLIVEDDGDGFDYKNTLENNCFVSDAIDLNELQESGRGILLISNLCDRLIFNVKGNKITAVKKLI
jgi:serine/threonine-protein kinase RsbW